MLFFGLARVCTESRRGLEALLSNNSRTATLLCFGLCPEKAKPKQKKKVRATDVRRPSKKDRRKWPNLDLVVESRG
jgi:hypothetical protein